MYVCTLQWARQCPRSCTTANLKRLIRRYTDAHPNSLTACILLSPRARIFRERTTNNTAKWKGPTLGDILLQTSKLDEVEQNPATGQKKQTNNPASISLQLPPSLLCLIIGGLVAQHGKLAMSRAWIWKLNWNYSPTPESYNVRKFYNQHMS
jgi:hypothetical protein